MRGDGRTHIEELLTSECELCALSSHHMTNDLPVMPTIQFIRVCLLRHPIERIRSVYDFERTQEARTPGAKAAKSMDFRDYVQWRMLPQVAHTIRNYQTLYLAGAHGLADEREMAVRFLPDALEVARGDALIGLVERYDESMVVLEDSLADYFPGIDLSYVAQNVSKVKRQKNTAQDPVARTLQELGDLQRTVIDKNSFDLALYQVVSERLDGRIQAVEHFDKKLANFQKRCRRLRRKKVNLL